jgi:hypothetical protein
METARKKNIKKAHQYYRGLADNLRSIVVGWPPEMKSSELKQNICDLLPDLGPGRTSKGYDWRSCRQRLIRLKLISFDPLKRLWANQCSLMIDNQQDNGIN